MKIQGNEDAKVQIFAITALGTGRETSLTLGRGNPRYTFYRKLSGSQGDSRHEGVKKYLHLSAA